MNDKKICLVGGDHRQIYTAKELLKNNYNVSFFGLNDVNNVLDGKIKESPSLEMAIKGALAVVLPLPVTTDNIRIFCPLSERDIKLSEVVKCLHKDQIVAGGKIPAVLKELVNNAKCKCFDYNESESFCIKNAIPTAEGALSVTMNELKTTVFGTKCAILGYGRIAKVLSKTLCSLGAQVTIFARNASAISWAECSGCKAYNINKLENKIASSKVIFNTIPSVILTKNILDKIEKDAVIIDLASAPGGVDSEYAKKIGRKVIYALSLPGKVAPATAGKIVTETVLSYIQGEEL